jgi:hypothetical protein
VRSPATAVTNSDMNHSASEYISSPAAECGLAQHEAEASRVLTREQTGGGLPGPVANP